MHSYVVKMLQCPSCHGLLTWQVDHRERERIVKAEARCNSCDASYPVRDGIGIFLTPDLARNDYWDANGSGLLKYLQDSPRVLLEDRQRLMAFGLYEKVSLLAFDARRTPFRDGVVRVMTTYAGLGNIESPGALLRELRRIVSGRFLALSHFCPEDDPINGEVLKLHGMEQVYFRRLALQNFDAAGWQVKAGFSAHAKVAPTPKSDLIPNATVDGFPVAPSEFEFCVLDAT